MKQKSWILLLIFIIFPIAAQAASPETMRSLTAKLEAWETEEAWREVKTLLLLEQKDPDLLELASHIAFYRRLRKH
jgi:hypothetical protein